MTMPIVERAASSGVESHNLDLISISNGTGISFMPRLDSEDHRGTIPGNLNIKESLNQSLDKILAQTSEIIGVKRPNLDPYRFKNINLR